MRVNKLLTPISLIAGALFLGMSLAYSAEVILDDQGNPPPPLVANVPAIGRASYVFTDLGALPGGNFSLAAAINEAGHITGCSTSNTTTRAFSYFNGTMTDLGAFEANQASFGMAINLGDEVVGRGTFTSSVVKGLLATTAIAYSTNHFINLGNVSPNVLISSSTRSSTSSLRLLNSQALAINDTGVAVGNTDSIVTTLSGTTSTETTRNFAAKFARGGIALIQTPNQGIAYSSAATGINNSGDIIGWDSFSTGGAYPDGFFMASGSTATIISGPPNTYYLEPLAINDFDQITGNATSITISGNSILETLTSHAFLSNGASTGVDLGTLGGNESVGRSINNNGDVVGESTISNSTFITHGFIYTGGNMTDLNSLTLTGAAGYVITSANGTNSGGQIVGQATDPNGHGHAYLLTPTSEATPPSVNTPLADALKLKGQSITLTSDIVGSGPFTYKWFKNKVAMANQSNATLTLTNLQVGNTGNYSVTAANLVGDISDEMRLTVVIPPAISNPPVNTAVLVGKPVKLSVTATGTAPIAYQWQISTDGGNTFTNITNGGNVTGANLSTLSLGNSLQGMDGQQFQCIITNAGSSLTSEPVTLTVGAPPKFTAVPANLVEVVGQDATFSATVSGSPAPTFQWFKGKNALNGETNSTLSLTNVQAISADTYSVTATNVLGSATVKATLKIIAPASITKQPINVSVVSGKPAKFAVTAVGTAKLTYQWQMSTDGGTTWADIPKATTATYSISKTAALMDGQQFRCIVNNAAAAPATSNAATLTINSQ